ncbi:hypothetical protein llap_5588 [Limosa lapponica baueri]|uniref:Uncharacterized protein n=1 Tax=Limosa lapponica baueri TaxID=1758121 RepID=A0A2I0UDJ9_LIMLA|nr:hypothetical protein llap_5588 [Limosa lapponica baueri]
MRLVHHRPEVQEMGPCLAKDGMTPKTSSTSHPHSWASSAPATTWTAQDPRMLLDFCCFANPRTLYGTLSWCLTRVVPKQAQDSAAQLAPRSSSKSPTITVRNSLSSPCPGLAASAAPQLWWHCTLGLPHLSSCGKTVLRSFRCEDRPVKTEMSPISGGSMDILEESSEKLFHCPVWTVNSEP